MPRLSPGSAQPTEPPAPLWEMIHGCPEGLAEGVLPAQPVPGLAMPSSSTTRTSRSSPLHSSATPETPVLRLRPTHDRLACLTLPYNIIS